MRNKKLLVQTAWKIQWFHSNLLQGLNVRLKHLPCWQKSPIQFGWHWHVNPPWVFTQFPPFLQGFVWFGAHSLTSANKCAWNIKQFSFEIMSKSDLKNNPAKSSDVLWRLDYIFRKYFTYVWSAVQLRLLPNTRCKQERTLRMFFLM